MRIVIQAGKTKAQATLADTATARAVFDAMPIEARLRTWGEEIYFPIPVSMDLDDTAAELVEVGDLGYWPTGEAFCIFFGATPMSAPGEVRPASAVNVIGRVEGDAGVFKAARDGEIVRLDRAS